MDENLKNQILQSEITKDNKLLSTWNTLIEIRRTSKITSALSFDELFLSLKNSSDLHDIINNNNNNNHKANATNMILEDYDEDNNIMSYQAMESLQSFCDSGIVNDDGVNLLQAYAAFANNGRSPWNPNADIPLDIFGKLPQDFRQAWRNVPEKDKGQILSCLKPASKNPATKNSELSRPARPARPARHNKQ
jgi:hypothetical protein